MTNDTNKRIKALAKFLDTDKDNVDEVLYGGNMFDAGGGEYLVLTDDEADDAAAEQIEQSLWIFNAEFIIGHTNLPYDAIEMIKSHQKTKYEDANDTIKALISDFDHFVSDAISSDGRGHFLAGYDSEEGEEDGYYIYRTN